MPNRPPPPQVELVPAPPGPPVLFGWEPGRWRWLGGEWEWAPGHYVRRDRDDARWIPGHWVERHGGWAWVPGRWVIG